MKTDSKLRNVTFMVRAS